VLSSPCASEYNIHTSNFDALVIKFQHCIIIAFKGSYEKPLSLMKDFQEIQIIKHWLIWLVLIGILLLFTFMTVSQLILGISVGNNPIPNWALIIGVLFFAFLVVLVAQTQLKLKLNNKELQMQFGALGLYQKKWSEIKELKIISMPLGGIGRRKHHKYGMIFNAGSKYGLLVQTKDGASTLISTRQKNELEAYLKAIKKKKS
jgi:hypothetical protein